MFRSCEQNVPTILRTCLARPHCVDVGHGSCSSKHAALRRLSVDHPCHRLGCSNIKFFLSIVRSILCRVLSDYFETLDKLEWVVHVHNLLREGGETLKFYRAKNRPDHPQSRKSPPMCLPSHLLHQENASNASYQNGILHSRALSTG